MMDPLEEHGTILDGRPMVRLTPGQQDELLAVWSSIEAREMVGKPDAEKWRLMQCAELVYRNEHDLLRYPETV
jgi:hypothetical protein